jgi:hypothetical protein
LEARRDYPQMGGKIDGDMKPQRTSFCNPIGNKSSMEVPQKLCCP